MELKTFLPLVPLPFRAVATHLLDRLASIESRLERLELRQTDLENRPRKDLT